MLVAFAIAAGCGGGGGSSSDDSDAGDARDGAVGAVDAPEVDGEALADHRRPSWIWTVPDGATGFRVRVDDGSWSELDLETSWWTSTDALGNGVHTFEVQARDGAGLFGPSGTFDTEVAPVDRTGDAFWGMTRVMATSPLGHACALSAHNAYSDDLATATGNLDATLSLVHAAQAAGADLIELDLVHAGGAVRIAHTDDGAVERALLADVLADPALRDGDQILFLELKEKAPTEELARELLDTIAASGRYARPGRHVVLRAFEAESENLELLRTLLDSPEYLLLRPYVRLSVLFARDGATRALVTAASERGFDMVEIDYRQVELMTLVALARALGLGTSIFTVPVEFGDVFVASARESVDAITVDLPIESARTVVERPGSQFFVDVSGEVDDSVDTVFYRRTEAVKSELAVNDAAQPILSVGASDDPLPLGHLAFDAAASRAGSLYDADAPAGGGVLVAVSARLATTALPDGETMALVAKSELGGWTLELHNPDGAAATVLRFGVYVAGAYRYASTAASALSTTRAHLITAAYDGDGGVRMWIDNDDAGVTVTTTSGGVVNNDRPVLLGADPGDPRRYFFDGEIQVALGQMWGPAN